MIKKLVFSISVLLLLAGLSLAINGCDYITGEAIKVPAQIQPQVLKNITSLEAHALIQANAGNRDFIIIDVRTPEEYDGGHIENAVNVDLNSEHFRDNISKFDKNMTYLVYCRTGVRSTQASNIMKELTFQNIYNMTGGITDWVAKGLPLAK